MPGKRGAGGAENMVCSIATKFGIQLHVALLGSAECSIEGDGGTPQMGLNSRLRRSRTLPFPLNPFPPDVH